MGPGGSGRWVWQVGLAGGSGRWVGRQVTSRSSRQVVGSQSVIQLVGYQWICSVFLASCAVLCRNVDKIFNSFQAALEEFINYNYRFLRL